MNRLCVKQFRHQFSDCDYVVKNKEFPELNRNLMFLTGYSSENCPHHQTDILNFRLFNLQQYEFFIILSILEKTIKTLGTSDDDAISLARGFYLTHFVEMFKDSGKIPTAFVGHSAIVLEGGKECGILITCRKKNMISYNVEITFAPNERMILQLRNAALEYFNDLLRNSLIMENHREHSN